MVPAEEGTNAQMATAYGLHPIKLDTAPYGATARVRMFGTNFPPRDRVDPFDIGPQTWPECVRLASRAVRCVWRCVWR